MAADLPVPLSSLKPELRAMVEFYANPANSTTFRDEVKSAQAAGLEKYAPRRIAALFRRKNIQAAIQAYAEANGFQAPVKTAADVVSERQDALLDDMIDLNILDTLEQVEIVRVDDRGNEYIERQLQPKDLEQIRPFGRFIKGIEIKPTKLGQHVKLDFHDKLAAKRLRDQIHKRLGGDGGAGIHTPTVVIMIPSLSKQQPQIQVIHPEPAKEEVQT